MSFLDDKAGAKSDLDGLTAFDSNGDGLFSEADQAWADFRIWQDADLDGAVDGGELVTMAGAGIASISLAGVATNRQWAWGDNIVVNNGEFTRADGSQSALADVAFSYAPGRAEPPAAPLEPARPDFWWGSGGRLMEMLLDYMADAPRPFLDRVRWSADRSGGDDGGIRAHMFADPSAADGEVRGLFAAEQFDPWRPPLSGQADFF